MGLPKDLFWICGTTRRWDGYTLRFQEDPVGCPTGSHDTPPERSGANTLGRAARRLAQCFSTSARFGVRHREDAP